MNALQEIKEALIPNAVVLLPDWLTVQFIVNNVISLAPLFSYGSAVYSIYKAKSSYGFSIDICCTMMLASILRINYYIIQPFEYTLLKQAIIMIGIHTLLLRISLSYKLKESVERNPVEVPMAQELKQLYQDGGDRGVVIGTVDIVFRAFLRFFDPHYVRGFNFWQWDKEYRYWRFLAEFAAVSLVLTYFLRAWPIYGESVGTLSLLIESLLPLPQILLLHRIKSTTGFKTIMLVSWYGGDLTKISYLLFGVESKISVLFIVFALFQMGLDFIIGGQYVYYKYYYRVRYEGNYEKMEMVEKSKEVNRTRASTMV